jgi:hypothetical protein
MNRPDPAAPWSNPGYDYGTPKSALSPVSESDPVTAGTGCRLDRQGRVGFAPTVVQRLSRRTVNEGWAI